MLKNIVIIGEISPSNFDKFFFIKNRILNEDEFLKNSIFSSNHVELHTIDFSLRVLPTQMIFTSKLNNKKKKLHNIATKVLNGIDFRITALGINVHWFAFMNEDYYKTSKNLFYYKNNILNDFFNKKDTAYGYYISDNFKDSRLKLDIKPTKISQLSIVDNKASEFECLAFKFNFHFDIINREDIFKCLSDYNLYINHSEKIIEAHG